MTATGGTDNKRTGSLYGLGHTGDSPTDGEITATEQREQCIQGTSISIRD